ncbi:MAG TPA: nucleotide disphospho-sugar-binding domain-containing protein [Pirellulales bacterium]
MARILLTWELGSGLGHAMNLRPLATELARRGHEIFLAAKDLYHIQQIFESTPITFMQAPTRSRQSVRADPIVTFADLLFNIGFGDQQLLAAQVAAWRNLFVQVRPHIIICDHSPTALLAARGQPFAVATVGTGFFCPIDETPLRLLRKVPPDDLPAVRAREQQVVENMNWALKELPARRIVKKVIASSIVVSPSNPLISNLNPAKEAEKNEIERVTQLYHDGQTKHFLLTFPELDHFRDRKNGDYRGAWPYGLTGQPFVRPASGKCVFAYLKPFPALEEFLTLLAKSLISATLYIDGWQETEWAKYRTERLHFATGPVEIHQAATGCDAAITNANHGTCVAMLLAGKPLVHVPPFLEQTLLAAAIDRLSASITANQSDPNAIFRAIERVLAEPAFTAAAQQFAARHANDSQEESIRRLIDDLEALVV